MVVAAVALIGKSGTILMQRRHFSSEHGGLWEFPGGKLESGESAEGAAIREIEEELGIVIAADSLEPVGFASGPGASANGMRTIVILLYACRVWHGEPIARDAAAIGWYGIGDIAALAMPPLDYPLARALGEKLAAKS